MFGTARAHTIELICLAALVAGSSSAALHAQEALPAEFLSLYDDLMKPGVVLTIDQGRAALDQLSKLGLSTSALPTEARIKLLRAECLAHLAIGDAKNAADRAAALAADAAGAKEALETIWLAAIASGNAEQANEAGKLLAKTADADAKRALAKRRRQLKAVARTAPDDRFNSSEDRAIALAEREGGVLLIDVWSLRDKPETALIDAMKKLKADTAGQPNLDLLSLNIDGESKRDAAAKFVADNPHTWPTAFAASGDDTAGPLLEAFDAGLPPWQAVIDQHGLIRAVGDLREPALQYAFRAAHAEARGDYPAVLPRTIDGKQAEPPAAEDRDSAADGPGSGGGDTAPPPLGKPSNPEAAELLKQVRLFRKTGNFTKAKEICKEIIEKYPGTHEAEEADFYLRSMP